MAFADHAQQTPHAMKFRFQMPNTRPTTNGNKIWKPVPMISMTRSPNGEKSLCPTSCTAMSRNTSTGTCASFTIANQP